MAPEPSEGVLRLVPPAPDLDLAPDPLLPEGDEVALQAVLVRNRDLVTMDRIQTYLQTAPLPPARAVCRQCRRVFKNERGLAIHTGKAHA